MVLCDTGSLADMCVVRMKERKGGRMPGGSSGFKEVLRVGLLEPNGRLYKKNVIEHGLIQSRDGLEGAPVLFRSLSNFVGWSWLPYKLSEVSIYIPGE